MAGRAAEVVVVDVGEKHGVEGGHICRSDGRLKDDGHVEAFEYGVDHDAGAARVDEQACAAEPGDGGLLLRGKGVGADGRDGAGHGLPLAVGDDGQMGVGGRGAVGHGASFR